MDLSFFYRANNGLVDINSNLLPSPRQTGRTTRSTYDQNLLTFVSKKCRTLTYQRSFFIRTCRVWNTLPASIRLKDLTFKVFKTKLYNYYNYALNHFYVSDDPRTWRSVCPKCHVAHSLDCPPTCCF